MRNKVTITREHLPREDYGAWLDPGNQDVTKLKAFIRSYPATQMKAYAVSKAVSSARNEGVELIAPLAALA